MVAKDLDSRYAPGRRSEAWTKIKRERSAFCMILGFLPEGSEDLKSLIIGTEEDGRLVCVGRVGSGLTAPMRRHLRELCEARRRPNALVDCGMEGSWVEPGLFCTVKYLERTENGLRAPVFVELVEG